MQVSRYLRCFVVGSLSLFASALFAEEPESLLSEEDVKAVIAERDVINLDGVQIRGNKELPQILYIVPWQEVETKRRVKEQDIMLFSLSERRIKPVIPDMNKGSSGGFR